jgi:hypothetical protein
LPANPAGATRIDDKEKESAMTRNATVAAALVMIVATAPIAADEGPHGGPAEATFKVGKNGDVKIGEDLKVGDVVVKRGKYKFEHRIEADQHTVVLTRIEARDAAESWYEIPMRLVAARGVPKRTVVYAEELPDHSLILTLVEVAGENGNHVPETQIRRVHAASAEGSRR